MRVLSIGVGIAGVVVIGLGVYLAHAERAGRAPQARADAEPGITSGAGEESANETVGGAPAPATPRPARRRGPSPTQARIQEAIAERLPQIHNAADLDRYLAELEARARYNRQVTALDVEPGMMAIQQQVGDIGPAGVATKTAEFAKRMNDLAAAERARAGGPPATPDLAELTRAVEQARGREDARQVALRKYAEAVANLPAAEQPAAAARLNQLAHEGREVSQGLPSP